MFEKLWQSLGDVARGASPPEDRREAMYRMKETLVQARMGLDDLRGGLRLTEERLVVERAELETAERRQRLAEGINDAETAALAERYARQHRERVETLVAKLAVQQQEIAQGEREVEEMTAELKSAAAGIGAAPPAAGGALHADPLDDGLAGTVDAMGRAQRRAAQDQAAEERLAELKRRMGR
jgi:small-conductance mechanosensitive channel